MLLQIGLGCIERFTTLSVIDYMIGYLFNKKVTVFLFFCLVLGCLFVYFMKVGKK